MSQYRLARGALADLRDIEAYTCDNWGAEQRNLSMRALAAAFQRLAENPAAERVAPDIRDGLRSYVCQQHVIFYRVSASSESFTIPATCAGCSKKIYPMLR